jgi:hypothetical protein
MGDPDGSPVVGHNALQIDTGLSAACVLHYILWMSPKSQSIQIRLSEQEKAGFAEAAALAGIPISSWVRERLRLAAIRELESAGRPIPFVRQFLMGDAGDE